MRQDPRKTVLAKLARASSTGIIRIDEAARALGIPNRAAGIRLAQLARRGWLTRVQRGLYLLVPIDAASAGDVAPEDPWILGQSVFAPCYVAGWSAAEFWELTEQLFRSTFIATAASIRRRDQILAGSEFHVVRVKGDRLVDLAQVWRGRQKLPVSDRERTIVDAARDPSWLGGVRHLSDVIRRYAQSGFADTDALAIQLQRHGNGAAAKRIGYLVEVLWPSAEVVLRQALALRSAGVIKLDPAVQEKGDLITRWGLRVNVAVKESAD